MNDSCESTQEFESIPEKLEIAHTGRAPGIDDIEIMYGQCKVLPGTDLQWVWKGKTGQRRFTLSVKYPVISQTGWWDYEVRDDPTWLISDDRKQGNNEIWKQKTCDRELVLLYCGMAESKSETSECVFDTVGLTDGDAKSVEGLATLVFAEILEGKPYIPSDGFTEVQTIHTVLKTYELEHFTGRIEILSNHELALIYMENGVPVHASIGSLTGDTALHEIVSWQKGAIERHAGQRSGLHNISKPLDILVAEGFALLEQKRHLANSGVTYESYLTRTAIEIPELASPTHCLPQELVLILDHLNRKLTLTDLIRDLNLPPTQWVPALTYLLQLNAIMFKPAQTRRATALNELISKGGGATDKQVVNLINPKTGIFKFQALLLFLVREFEQFRSSGEPLSLAIFDIKRSGSELKTKWLTDELANLVSRKVELVKRPLDLFTHFEITEFALLLPGTSLDQAKCVAKRVLQMLTTMPEGLVASCGIATLPEHGETVEALMTYGNKAKENGRNENCSIYVCGADELMSATQSQIGASGYFHEQPDAVEIFENIGFGELLARSDLISPDQFEEANEFAQKTNTPLARVLNMQGIKIEEDVITMAEQVHALIERKDLSVLDGIKAVELIGNHGLDLETAMRRLGRVLHANPLGDLLRKSAVVEPVVLDQAILDSGNMGLPLGFVLVSRGLLTRNLLHDVIDLLRLVRYGSHTEPEAIEALQAVHSGSLSLGEYLKNSREKVPSKPLSFGDLLVDAGLISDSEFITARELAFIDNKRLLDVLEENGFACDKASQAARDLVKQVKDGSSTRDDAAKELRSKFAQPTATIAPSSPDPDVAIDKMQTARTVQDLKRPDLYGVALERSEPSSQPSSVPSPSRGPRRPTRSTMEFSTPEIDPKNVDRVELLRRAGRIDNESFKKARYLSRLHEVPTLRILYELGSLDDADLSLSASAKRKIEAGEIEVHKAIQVIKLCREKSLSFEEGFESESV